MRSRNVKPGLLKNEILGSADPLLTVLFVGLWMAADREGRLEDRPLRLCAELFPYRRAVTAKRMDSMLQWLNEQKFIARYSTQGNSYIQVLEFKKHQRPHSNEVLSIIPSLTSNCGSPRSEVAAHQGEQRFALIPDSLIPDSGLPEGVPSDHPKNGNGHVKAATQTTPFPDDLILSDAMTQQALRRYPDCDVEQWFELFAAHHRAHGKKMKSWPHAWVTWIGNGEQFGYPRRKPDPGATNPQEAPRFL